MVLRKSTKVTNRYRIKKTAPDINKNESLIKGSWFLTLFILISIVVFSGVAIGGILYNFFVKEVRAEVENALLLKADNCKLNLEPKHVLNVRATAYSSSPAQTDSTPCITATGFDVCENYALYGADNTIASNFLPMHSVVRIPELYGDKLFVVRDKMNRRYGSSYIDIWMPTYSEARRFGSKQVTIEVY